MTRKVARLALFGGLASAAVGCAREQDGPSTGFEIKVSPLSLANVGGATYTIEIFAGDPALGAERVVELGNITSGQYGDGKGSISYVAPCDASVETNYVRLTLEALRDNNGEPIDADTWQNPTPLVKAATCQENKDTPVVFNLTILRDAEQGFFDIGVNFSDIFCSAKFDCRDKDGLPLELLHNEDGERDTTVVLAFACTAGGDDTTWLHMSDVHVECRNGPETTTHWISPGGDPGQRGEVDGMFFQTALYQGSEQLEPYDKCYWNLAFGLADDAPSNCTLVLDATASDTSWHARNGVSPDNTVYPYVHYEIPLTGGEGELACARHALNDAADLSERVSTRYTNFVGAAFPFEKRCGADDDNETRVECTSNVQGLGATTALFTDSPSSVSVAFGDDRSQAYQLPEGFQVGTCCLNPCCTAPATAGD